jgi:hypothetical protein
VPSAAAATAASADQDLGLSAAVDELAERRAADALRDRERAGGGAGRAVRTGEVLDVDEHADRERGERQAGDDGGDEERLVHISRLVVYWYE